MSQTTADNGRMKPELRAHLSRAFRFDDPPETFAEFWERMVSRLESDLGRRLTLDDLCTTADSPHWAEVDGERQHYQCVTDAFLLGMVLDEPVTVRTVTPVAEQELVVEFGADGSVSAPEGAVLSWGVERTVEPPEGPVTPGKMYGRVCPYSKAFASREAYEEWTAANPGVASQALPLGDAIERQAEHLSRLHAGEEGSQPITDDEGAGPASTGESGTDGCGCGGSCGG